MKLTYLQLAFALLLIVSTGRAQSIREQLEEVAIIDEKVMMPMRDGVRLATDIFRPKTDEKVPIIFSRTPYNFNAWRDGEESTRTYKQALDAVKRGYAFVVQNERGRYFSEGEWDILGVPLTDGYDALTWMSEQSWSNGKIGLIGCSSTAEWQMAVSSMNHPALAAMVPMGFGAGIGRVGQFMEQGNWYRGGVYQMLFGAWLYGVEHDKFKPRIPAGATQEDLIRISRYYDLAPENPKVEDMREALSHLPIQDFIVALNGKQEIYDKMIRRKPNDPAWFEGGLYHDNMEISTPSFWFTSWYDVSISPNLALFNHVRNTASKEIADNQYLVIAPTLHCGYWRASENTIVGERSVGDARLNYDSLIYNGWFDHFLKGEESNFMEGLPRVQYFTMGSNKWQTADTWPPANAKMTPLYLESEGRANSLFGNGKLKTSVAKTDKPDHFTYDPMNPVYSYGGNVCCTGNAIKAGSFDQREQETREDILVYTTAPLAEGVEISGSIEMSLYVSSDVKDTDFTVKLIDVYPDGSAYNLDETIQRARYREGYDKEVFMEEDKVYQIDLTPLSTSNYFEKGHSIRIEVSSSNFPRFARNLNTGGNNYDETEGIVAHNTIHHSSDYPSKITIPVIGKLKFEK
ncbi:CocE/NonD family hydrolase [Marinoscillum pacificum]|uniref:CocE/NonD family hydrolase n=1 Tax=Marinoscillum pacificum TaxID=392723 RepID=UPI002157E4A6|nr:CocE/NonD family hydrolase [Marinoscillum pacificum]